MQIFSSLAAIFQIQLFMTFFSENRDMYLIFLATITVVRKKERREKVKRQRN